MTMAVQIDGPPLRNFTLFVIILLEGFVTISLEILTIRQLIPVAGNSVVVTSLIIGIFLLFLAYGYLKGSRHIANYSRILKTNFTLAAIGLGFGVSYFFIKWFFFFVGKYISHQTLVSLIAYLLLVTAPIVYWLGQTVPLTFNLFKEQRASLIGGRVLYVSTLGSFLGAVLTALLLFNYLGVAWTVFINFIVLSTLVIILTKQSNRSIYLLPLVFAGYFIFVVNVQVEKNLFVLTNNYGNYQVIDEIDLQADSASQSKLLEINDSFSSSISDKKKAFPYIEFIKQKLFGDLGLRDKNILVLGAGGFTLSAESEKNNHFTYVDIDKQIAKVVRAHFMPVIKGDFIADDARHYLHKTAKHYDVVVADTYSNQHAIPVHLLTKEYFAEIRHVLTGAGIVVVNVIARPVLDDKYSKRIDNTIRSVFSNCMVTPLAYSQALTNIIYFCRKSDTEKDNMVYSDNLNKSTLDFFNLH